MSLLRLLVLLPALAGCVLLEPADEPEGGSSSQDGAPSTTSPPPAQRGGSDPAPEGGRRRSTWGGGGDGSAPPPPAPPPAREDEPAQPGELRLDARWAPLEAIVERAPLPGLSNTAATTIGAKVYVVDLERWLKRHPQGTPLFDAVLLHEQEHARRQLAAGVDPWIERYLRDRAFMWAEEQRGWYHELRHLRGRGLQVDAKAVARALSKYSNLAGPMVGYDEALAWVEAVLLGRWSPP